MEEEMIELQWNSFLQLTSFNHSCSSFDSSFLSSPVFSFFLHHISNRKTETRKHLLLAASVAPSKFPPRSHHSLHNFCNFFVCSKFSLAFSRLLHPLPLPACTRNSQCFLLSFPPVFFSRPLSLSLSLSLSLIHEKFMSCWLRATFSLSLLSPFNFSRFFSRSLLLVQEPAQERNLTKKKVRKRENLNCELLAWLKAWLSSSASRRSRSLLLFSSLPGYLSSSLSLLTLCAFSHSHSYSAPAFRFFIQTAFSSLLGIFFSYSAPTFWFDSDSSSMQPRPLILFHTFNQFS